MKNLIKKFFDADIKAADGNDRAFWFTASTEDRDRDGDVIVARGWKLNHFKKNPVILWAHQYSQPPIGKAIDVKVEDNRLRILVEFATAALNPFAEQVFQMVKAGFLKTMSVGFQPYKVEDLTEEDKKQRPEMTWGKRIWAELMESSIVPVPANPMALMGREFGELMVKGFAVAPVAQPLEEKEHELLPFKEEDGQVSVRLVQASMAALLGARGGVKVPAADRTACFNKLARHISENGGTPPALKEYTQDELRGIFKDVWNDELLDVINTAMEKTGRDEQQVVEEQARQKEVAESVLTILKSMEQTVKDLSALKDRLN